MTLTLVPSPAPGPRRPAPDLATRLEGCLTAAIEARARTLLDVGPELAPVLESVLDQVARGKRLRGSFCYWGWLGAVEGRPVRAGRDDDDVAIEAAAALELFHVAALVHDDVMDRSPTRRGLPSVRARFAGLHRDDALTGDATVFGDGVAILVGDLCLSWSDELLAGCGAPRAELRRARTVFDTMRTQVIAGQYLDLVGQAGSTVSVEQARAIIRYKSAKYTVEQPLLIGGELAGARPDVLAAYSAYGLAVGEAFQLRDDVLGVWGDPATTGKPVGEDLREGKQTVLLTLARERAGGGQRRALELLVGAADLDQDGAAEVRAVMVDTGALAEVEERIGRLHDEALEALDTGPVGPTAVHALTGLARQCAWRSR